MNISSVRSLERNSRLTLAIAKNRAEENQLKVELGYLDNEKKTALRILQNDRISFKTKYSKSTMLNDSSNSLNDTLNKYYVPSDFGKNEEIIGLNMPKAKHSYIAFEQIHNMLFTNEEVDVDKILCLHLISAHRTESLQPPKRPSAVMCKIHSPLERLLDRSKRKHIHLEQKMTSILPIYTLETEAERLNTPINDGRLATRLLLNEKIRELINTVLNALRQSNPEKNYEIFEMANDISVLKKLFTKRHILDFLEDLMELPLINNCESFILTAPFRVKSTQLEIKTLTGSVEQFVRQIRQNVLQIPVRPKIETAEDVKFEPSPRKITKYRTKMSSRTKRRSTDESVVKDAEFSFNDRSERRFSDPEKKVGRHTDKNFIQKNIQHAATVRKIEYDTDEEDTSSDKRRRSSQSSNKPRRRSSDSPPASIADRPDLQPVKLSEDVVAILEDMAKEGEDKTEKPKVVEEKVSENNPEEKARRSVEETGFGGRIVVQDHMRIHLKQTTCPACMEKYRIPLPTPKTPRVKPSSVIPLAPGVNPDLKTNSQHRLSMLINKEMFKLQSYERRFSSDENSRRNSLRKQELESCSSEYLNLSPLELAKIELEIKEKETQKKLQKFLGE